MDFGKKLQFLRRQSGLSQEQLASQLSVSRQAVSRWELNETMPDTENVLQLSRLFGVSCDYLLCPEADDPGPPVAPGEAHLTEQGWTHNAAILSLAACAVGLLLALGGWLREQSSGPLVIGLIVQVLGLALFELAAPRMGKGCAAARLRFYLAANWLLAPIPLFWLLACAAKLTVHWPILLLCDLLFSGAVTVILAIVLKKCFPQRLK